MYRNTTTRHRREFIVMLALAIIVGGGIFTYFFLIGGMWFLGMLGTIVVLALVGLFHYLLWGRTAERRLPRQPPRDDRPREPFGDGMSPARFGPPD
jgi:hypothetical protein